MSKKALEEAIIVLAEYQKWRKGQGEYRYESSKYYEKLPYDGDTVLSATDVLLAAVQQPVQVTDEMVMAASVPIREANIKLMDACYKNKELGFTSIDTAKAALQAALGRV